MLKRILALLIALVMLIGLFTACVSNNTKGSENNMQSSQLTGNEGVQNDEETLKVKRIRRGAIIDDIQEPTAFELKVKELFNIEFETTVFPEQDYEQKIILLFTSGEIPEFIDIVNGYAGYSMEKLALEGFLIPLNDYLNKIPEYRKRFSSEADYEFTIKDASIGGKLYYLPWPNYRTTPYGWIYKKVYLEQLGLEFPKTIDELLYVLAKVKEDKPEWAIPGRVDYGGLYRPTMGLFSAYRTANGWYIDPDENNALTFGPITDKYRELLKTARYMYKQGYIHKEAETFSSEQYNNWMSQKKIAIMYTAVNQINDNKPDEPETEKYYYTDEYITAYNDKPGLWSKEPPYFKYGPAIVEGTSQEKIDRLIEFLKWMNTPAGYNFFFLGEEGVTFEYVNGKARFIGDYKKDETGIDYSDKFTKAGYGTALQMGYSVDFMNRVNMDPIIELSQKVAGKDNFFPVLSIKYTEQETKDRADISTLIDDTVKQYFVRFIMDDKLDPANDDHWKEYIDTLMKNGYERYAQITINAYNRTKQ